MSVISHAVAYSSRTVIRPIRRTTLTYSFFRMLKKQLVLHATVKLFTLDKSLAIHCEEQFYCFPYREIKTESTRKMSNFNF